MIALAVATVLARNVSNLDLGKQALGVQMAIVHLHICLECLKVKPESFALFGFTFHATFAICSLYWLRAVFDFTAFL